MKRNIVETFKELITYLIVPILICFLFKNWILEIIGKYFVSSFFKFIEDSSYLYDTSVIFLFLIITVSSSYKIALYNQRYKNKTIYFFIVVLVIYSYIRFTDTSFQFVKSHFFSKIYLMDLAFITPVIAVLISYLVGFISRLLKNNKSEEKLKTGFLTDEPVILNKEALDIFNRRGFIKEIAQRIKNTENVFSSFPIGIVSNWGDGKTTFLKTLLEEFSEKDYIIVEFNVWKCESPSKIIENFFILLNSKLSKYSLNISNALKEYSNLLLKDYSDTGVNMILNSINIFKKENSNEEQYEVINDEIKKIDKKIIIVIDDLDRLNSSELYEVIKLIRNTANFRNTIFLVAYDRTYLNNAISEINGSKVNSFLEKIFQLEFLLPPVSFESLKKDLNHHLKSILNTYDFNKLIEIQKNGYNRYTYGETDISSLFIKNMRDVKRFLNSFTLSYSFLKDEVYFPDYYNLEVLKFKCHELYYLIYLNSGEIFTTEVESSMYKNKRLMLKFDKNEKLTFLEKYIIENKDKLRLEVHDIKNIVNSFIAMFGINDSSIGHRTNSSELSVTKPSMFNRYFLLSISGRLSEVEFCNMRILDSDLIYNKIDEFCSKGLVNDLIEKFVNIKFYDSKEDYEKVINCIFYLGNLTLNGEKSYFDNFVGFDSENLSSKLQWEKVGKNLYSDINEFKLFLTDLLKTDSELYRFKNRFLADIVHHNHYYFKDIFSNDEISSILISNFEIALEKSVKFNYQLWWLYNSCEYRIETPTGGGSFTIKYAKIHKARKLMRNFIFKKDLDGFLKYTIKVNLRDENKFMIHPQVIYGIYPIITDFFKIIKRIKVESTYLEEYLKLVDELIIKPDSISGCVDREFFKVIPVEEDR